MVEAKSDGVFLSIASANILAKYWFLEELGDPNDEVEDGFASPSKNMWPGFWVPEGTTNA